MAKPFQEGAGWAYRLRVAGQDLYRSGFDTEASAKRDMEERKVELTGGPAPSGLGPYRTSLGAAFSNYACERLPFLKGARQDANRINSYLRALGLPVVQLTRADLMKDGKRVYWQVALHKEPGRTIPASLAEHRKNQSQASGESERVRKHLASMMMAEVTAHHIQPLINALRAEGKKAATIHLERSELRRLFKHASAVWKWRHAGGNPAGAGLDMPAMDAGRDRVVTNEEWQRLSVELAKYPNPHVAPLACLMLETAMRSCEPLMLLHWRHVNWQQRVLELPDGKGGARKVPLGPGALHILEQLKNHAPTPPAPDDQVFPTTYEAVKKAWAIAREQAGVANVGMHDLRHTSATRFALQFNGNVPALMLITGHKTVQMVMRYVNLKATEVATMMHNEALDTRYVAAGYQRSVTKALDAVYGAKQQTASVPEGNPAHLPILDAQVKQSVRDADDCEAGTAAMASSAPPASGLMRRGNIVTVDFRRRAA